MTTIARCPDCGNTLAPDAPMGLCVRCLLALEALASPAPSRGEAVRFGDYELLDAGKPGGMGRVYRARHTGLDRIVALKMINAGFLPTAHEMDRFRAEARAAGSLEHPHIVPLYEAGEHGGRGFFTMKWMEGGSLAERMGRQRLSECRATEIMIVISRAVHFAHQRGIIHRDLKPSNILLDGQGQPHVTDFGLAKRLVGTPSTASDSSSETITGAVERPPADPLTFTGDTLGTPAYMAPEQAAGKARDVTTAADVYSLGAILYELLTGRPPFTGDSPLEILRKVVEEEPPRPSLVRGNRRKEVLANSERTTQKVEFDQSLLTSAATERLDRDLETICLKCLEKEPLARYASAEALATDLDRWLNGEPILAQPASRWERAGKWVRRNPVITVLSAALILSVMAGFAAALWQLRQTERARQRAVANVEKTLEAITRYLTVAEDQPQWRGIRDMGVRTYEMRKALLQITVPLLHDLDAPINRDAGVAYQRAVAYRRVAEWNYLLGLPDDGLTNAQHARRIFQALAAVQPHSSVPRREEADTSSLLARLFWLPGLGPEAEAAHRETMFLNEGLVAKFPGEAIHRLKLAVSRADYAVFLCDPAHYPKRVAEGITLSEKVTDEFRRLMADNPDANDPKRAFAQTILNVETHLAKADRIAAERTNFLLQALWLARPLAASETPSLEDRALLGGLQSLLGEYQIQSREWAEAERSLREAAGLWDKLTDQAPTEMPFRWGQAAACDRLARLLMTTGRWAEGEQVSQTTVALLEKHLGRFPFDFPTRLQLITSYEDRAKVYQDSARHPPALELRRKALAFRELSVKDQPGRCLPRADLAAKRCELAELLLKDGQLPPAVEALSEALAHYEQLTARFPQDSAWPEKLQETRTLLDRLRVKPSP